MGWIRKLLGVPDDVWAAAAGKLGAEFVQGEWLANSEIKLSHRGFPITLGTELDDGRQYTRAVPGVSLNPRTRLAMLPQFKGLLGSITSRLTARTTIKIPALGEDYLVYGDDERLANEIFGHRDFVLALKGMTQNSEIVVAEIVVGCALTVELLADEDDGNFYVSVCDVLKDVHQLVALVDLTRVLLNVLDENGCLVVD